MRKLLPFACTVAFGMSANLATASILPPNDLHLQDTIFNSNITEEDFNEVITKAEAIYAPLIRDAFGGRLNVNRLWSNSTVNASASQFGGSWTVNMYGGLARRPEVTLDGFTLVLCHELGHHLGGYPFSSSWAANEGQSDYFATQSCARQLWVEDFELNESFKDQIPETPKAACEKAWTNDIDRALCYRTMAAGKSLADLFASLRNTQVSFDTPDLSEVRNTDNSHPDGQCRLDTYVAGALCTIDFDKELIPGKGFGRNRNSAQAEEEAISVSCATQSGFDFGTRPSCWFKSLL